MRRSQSGVFCVLCFCCLLLFGFTADAFAATEGAQKLSTEVPCTVTLNIGEHGSVTVAGKTYRGGTAFRAKLDTVLRYLITPDSGYEIARVVYDGIDVTARLGSGAYTAAALKGHVTVSVTFAGQTAPDGAPRTGDGSRTALWTALLCFSGAAGATVLILSVRRRRTS